MEQVLTPFSFGHADVVSLPEFKEWCKCFHGAFAVKYSLPQLLGHLLLYLRAAARGRVVSEGARAAAPFEADTAAALCQ